MELVVLRALFGQLVAGGPENPPSAVAVCSFLLSLRLASVSIREVINDSSVSDGSLVAAVLIPLFRVEAFEVLIARHDPVMELCFRAHLRRHPVDLQVEDLMAGSHLHLLSGALASYDRALPFRPWLWRVCGNLYSAERRRRRLELDPNLDVIDARSSPLEDCIALELEVAVEAAIEGLPTGQRDVMRLHLAAAPADDIADQLGLPIRKVYALLHKARNQIRQQCFV